MASLISPIGIVSYPRLFQAEAMRDDPNGKKHFSVSLIIEPSDPQLAVLKNEAARVANEFFKGKIPSNFRSPFIDGNTLDDPAAKGKVVMRFKSKEDRPPQVIGPDKQPISQTSGLVYAGCLGRVSCSCFAYDKMGNGVSFGLSNFQKTGDGPRIDGRKDADDEFDAVAQPVASDIFGTPAVGNGSAGTPSWF